MQGSRARRPHAGNESEGDAGAREGHAVAQAELESSPAVDRRRVAEGEGMSLQRSLGNRIVARTKTPPRAVVQASLHVGPSGDAAEREADGAAAAIAGGSTPSLRERPGRGLPVGETFTRDLQGLRGSGEPLADDVRSEMETRLGGEFGGVRVHTGARSAGLARDVGARAFTHGSDIFFARGRYEPRTPAGRSLLAHELAHTIQQGFSPAPVIQRDPEEGTIVHESTGVHKSNRKAIARGDAEVLAVGTGIKHRLAKDTVVTVDFSEVDPTGNYVLVQYADGDEVKQGYVHKNKVDPTTFSDPELHAHPAALQQGLTYEYQDRSAAPLFPDGVSVGHVKQGMLGDCYFVSAVASVVSKDPTAITSMMEDRGEHVRVRFYRDKKIQYVHVKKSVPGFAHGRAYTLASTGGQLHDPYAQGALWVTLLEKAYATFLGVSYDGLQAGTATDVWEHMLNVKTETESLALHAYGKMPWLNDPTSRHRQNELDAKKELFKTIFGDDMERVARWTALVDGKLGRVRDDSVEAVREFLTAKEVEPDLLGPVIGYLVENKVMSGYSGSGVYSTKDLATWERIRKLVVDDKEAVAAGTPKSYGRDLTGQSIDHKDGIHAEHSYTIVGASADGDLRYLRLRNPWGTGGIRYQSQETGEYGSGQRLTAGVDNASGGVFDIELVHFLATFQKLYTTRTAEAI